MTDQPTKPSDPRDGEPYYIDSECPDCGAELVLYDETSGWNDEWECPRCQDGIHMDWPQAEFDKLVDRAESLDSSECVSLDEMDFDIS